MIEEVQILIAAAVGWLLFRLNDWILPSLACLVVVIVYAVKVYLIYS